MAGKSIYRKYDWSLILSYLALLIFGWLNVYSSIHTDTSSLLNMPEPYDNHPIWMCTALFVASFILFIVPSRIYEGFSWLFYIGIAGLLLVTTFIGTDINGSKSWLTFGGFAIQPAEFSKITTSLALATLMSKYGFNIKYPRNWIRAFATIGLPMLLILLEKETGSMLVYLGFLLLFYREGMSGWLLLAGLFSILTFILCLVASPFVAMLVLLGCFILIYFFHYKMEMKGIIITIITIFALSFLPKILLMDFIVTINPFKPEVWVALITVAIVLFLLFRNYIQKKRDAFARNILVMYLAFTSFIFSVEFIFHNVLQDHQRSRIEVVLGIKDDPKGIGYNVHQSLIAIGSGGFSGKGYLQGTQTRLNFVPEQTTDFIFCTVGEEWGFLGALAILGIYFFMLCRIINRAEKNSDNFTRIYGYCVACCLLTHIVINISMTIGMMPVIGIPLPFISYGGSSLIAFTILLFIFIRLDFDQWKYLKQ